MARCYSSFRGYYECNGTWNSWGRWVLFAVIVVAFLAFFFLFSCLSARRRRKKGLQPFYGTGWAGHAPPSYNPQYPQQQQQQPQYGYGYQQQQGGQGYGQPGGYYNQNQGPDGASQGYYGDRSPGAGPGAAELQSPPNAYHGGDQVYAPPAGPPPGKDGVVR